MRASTKILLGFIVAVAALYFGYEWYAKAAIDGEKFAPIKPGRITILGLKAGGPYRILVQNRVAVLQLLEGEAEGFEAPDRDEADADMDVSGKRRIPIRELLQTLQGDEEALAHLILVMNNMKRPDTPVSRVAWKAEDVRRALEGDKALTQKLEQDIGVTLDGRPLEKISSESLFNGIIVQLPVTVRVPVGNQSQELTAQVDQHFRAAFANEVEKAMQGSDSRFRGQEEVAGIVRGVAAKIYADKSFQDVRGQLQQMIAPAKARSLAAPAQRIVANANVVVNDSMMEDASVTEFRGAEGEPYFTLVLELNEEGRRRLWKYSRENQGHQLLVIRDGIAIAAPLVRGELRRSTVDITQIQEEGLVRDTVNIIKQLNGEETR